MPRIYTELKKQGFPKQERIVSQKQIDELFSSGQSHSLTAFPLRAIYLVRKSLCKSVAKEEKPCESVAIQLLLSVPKRRFKHAVDRNRVKRQLREAFRKNKELLASAIPYGQCVSLAFIWMTDKHMPSDDVEQHVINLLKRIASTITVNQ